MIALGRTDLRVHELCLGGNTFGWSSSPEESLEVLDAYAHFGGNFVDTADMYSSWHPGNVGGESETIIGRWMADRGNRDQMVIATKVAKLETRPGLAAANIEAAVNDSLRRLQTDYIDVYYAHHDDESVSLEESLTAFDALVRSGKVRYIAASNYSAVRLREAVELSRSLGLSEYMILQPHFNLVVRDEFEGALQDYCVAENIPALPYYSLASGMLTGKYVRGTHVDSVRAEDINEISDDRPWAIVDAVRSIAAAHNAPMASVALEWLRHQPGVASPIASARNVSQLPDLLARVTLSADELALLSSL